MPVSPRVTGTAVPNTNTDWSQYVEATFTMERAGFAIINFVLNKYESGARLFVYPWPVVS